MIAVAVVASAFGLVLLSSGARRRRTHSADAALADLLDLPGSPVVDVGSIGFSRMTRVLELWREDGADDADPISLAQRVRRAAERPADVATPAGAVAAVFLLGFAVTGHPMPGVLLVVASGTIASMIRRRRRRQRTQKIEAQFPDALSMIASSLQAGNPLRRSLQILSERGTEPLAGELALVVAETELGAPLVDAVDRMADRVEIDDIRWFARALRIQQASGGQLAPLVRTIATVMTARAELQREARVLTAEGRMSAWVLGALPLLLIAACQAMNPSYLEPLFQGWGWVVLTICGASVGLGILWILRMVDAEVTA